MLYKGWKLAYTRNLRQESISAQPNNNPNYFYPPAAETGFRLGELALTIYLLSIFSQF